MAGDLQDLARQFLIDALDGGDRRSRSQSSDGNSGGGPLSGMKGVLAGAGAAAVLPMAVKGAVKHLGIPDAGNLLSGDGLQNLTSKLGSSVGSGLGEKVSEKVDEAGGPSGILKDMLPFGGGGDDDDDEDQSGIPGVGKGRRMPVQQSVDIGAPIEAVYNQWTQFETWPNFMHRVTSVSQEDETTVSFITKIWGKTKEFKAEIETQRPNERVKWKVTEGMAHTGVVTFHELQPRLTRVLLGLDVEPGGMLEKLARGARHVKRAARGDLHRFKAFIEMSERETGAWRGRIEDGEVLEDHDPSYDKTRDYVDLEELTQGGGSNGQKDDDGQSGGNESGRRSRSGGSRTGGSGGSASRGRQSAASKRSGSSKRSTSSSRSGSSGRSESSSRSKSSSKSGSSGSRSNSSRGRSSSSGSGTRSRSSSSSRRQSSRRTSH
jgi:uncharacterized membrane protein